MPPKKDNAASKKSEGKGAKKTKERGPMPRVLKKTTSVERKGDTIVSHTEDIIDGEKGTMIKFYKGSKDGKKKIVITRKGTDKFVLKSTINGVQDSKEMTPAELLSEVKKDSDLKFAEEFLKSVKGGQWLGGAKKKTRTRSASKSKKPASKKRNTRTGSKSKKH